MKTLEYNEHHCHTHFSIGDCITKIPDLVKRSLELKRKSVTITDHGSLGGIYELFKECKGKEIKPIIGLEAYYVDDIESQASSVPYNYAHLVILAKNNIGWTNLKLLHSLSWEKGFLKKPRIDMNMLKTYHEGLICSTACMGGLIGWNYLDEMDKFYTDKDVKKDLVDKRLQFFLDLFKEDFYFEISLNDLEIQRKVNERIIKLCHKMNGKLLITCDSHYIYKKDFHEHDIEKCYSRKKTLSDEDNGTYPTHEVYLKSGEQNYYSWQAYHDDYIKEEDFMLGIKSSVEISDKVEKVDLTPKGQICLPKYCENPHEEFQKLIMQGWHFKLTGPQQCSKVYQERLKTEEEVIGKLKMESYMLVCADIIQRAKKANIPVGPGRGSVCGSLVAYLMDITQIDPIRFNIIFERFLTAERLSLPDIDMDFGRDGRESVKNAVRDLYGTDKFAAIITYQDWKPKNLIKDIGKVLGRDFQEMNIITKKIHDKTKKFDDEEYSMNPDVITWLESNLEIYEPAKKLEGVYRAKGVHASGMILTPTKLEDWVPTAFMIETASEERKPVKVSEWDMYGLEDLNILKIDFLGLQTLDVIDMTVSLINRGENKITNIWETCLKDLENQEVYKTICENKIVGMFQLESSEGMAELVKKMKPICFYDIVMLISLYRTAIIKAGMMDEYIRRRNGADFDYLHPKIEPVLKDTLGILVFQEQLMEIAVVAGGMSRSESDNFRKATKLKDLEKFKKWEERFVNGCVKNGIDSNTAKELWDWCVKWSGYGFNTCISGDTVIHRFTGNQFGIKEITVKELYDSEHIKRTAIYKKFKRQKHLGLTRIYDFNTKSIKYGKINTIHNNGIAEVFKIILEDGKSIKATKNHRFLKSDENYEIVENLKIGDELLICGNKNLKFNKQNRNENYGRNWISKFKGNINENKKVFIDNRCKIKEDIYKQVKERAKGYCEICGEQEYGRFEFHHKDGNHFNDILENIIYVCNSCHKNEDYKIGCRSGKRDLGYLVEKSKIISIEYIGKEETYDVEMCEEPHNFVANGIVSHNSHATAYALISYTTGWLKTFYPKEYMAALMSYNAGDKDMMPRYIEECKKLKIKLGKPHINLSEDKFVLGKEKIIQPFSIIANVGEKVITAILEERKSGRFKSFDDFMNRIDLRVCNVRVLTNIILAGTFNKLEDKTIEEIYSNFVDNRKEKGVFRQYYCPDCKFRFPCTIKSEDISTSVCNNCGSGDIEFDFESEASKKSLFNKIYIQNQVYGFAVLDNPLKRYIDVISHYDAEYLSALDDYEVDTMVVMAAFVKNIKKWTDKRGGEMAFIDLSDGEFDCSMTVFAGAWEDLKNEINKNCCYIIVAKKNRGNNLLWIDRGPIKSKIIKLGL